MQTEAMATAPYMETEFIDTTRRDDTDRRATRWIVFAGDRMPPDQKRTFDGMAMGGDVLGHAYKTLAPTKGLLRRCQLTPMIIGHDDLNSDSLGVQEGADTSQYRRRDHFNAEARVLETIYFNECLPGDELAGLMTECQGVFDYGIREVTILKGVEPTKKIGGEIVRSSVDNHQREIFPDWDSYVSGQKEFFSTTEELREFLVNRSEFVNGTVKAIIGTLLESLAQFERWATRQLDNHSRLVKAPPTAEGKVYGWEPIHHQYFDAMQLNKDSFLMKKADDAPARDNSAPSKEEFFEYQRQTMQMFEQMLETNRRLADIAQANGKAEKKTCAGLKADGAACKASPQGETEFCVNHQPKIGV
jgi:hypothetical protein